MEILKLILPESGEEIEIQIKRKKMKYCRLKVDTDGSVSCSAPNRISKKWIRDFIISKADWIEKTRNKMRKSGSGEALDYMPEIKEGNQVTFLGENLRLSLIQGKRMEIIRKERKLRIYYTEASDQKKLEAFFEKWWREEGIRILDERTEFWYSAIKNYGIPYPRICLRKMKSLWGSCSINRAKITFNFYLLKAEPDCIDYVVLHELVHFLYPNHSREFYGFLERYMPDWKERRQRLNRSL